MGWIILGIIVLASGFLLLAGLGWMLTTSEPWDEEWEDGDLLPFQVNDDTDAPTRFWAEELIESRRGRRSQLSGDSLGAEPPLHASQSGSTP